jgi:predicted esterase
LDKISETWINVLHHLHEKYSFRYENIFLLGFSQGASMSCLISQKIKLGGLILISPSNLDLIKINKTKSTFQTPIYFSHGILDDKSTTTLAKKNVKILKTHLW